MKEHNKTWSVYEHWTPDNMVYVGVTGQDIKERWRSSHYKKTALQPYIEEFGWDNIEHKVVFEFDNEAEALKKEDELIQYYRELGICINKLRSGLIKAKDKKAYDRQWYQEHKEECSKNMRQWREEHKDELIERKRQWREEHKDEIAEYMRQYRQEHKEERKEYDNKRYLSQKDDPEYKKKIAANQRQYRRRKKMVKQMVESDLKRIKADQTINLMSDIIQFRKLIKKY